MKLSESTCVICCGRTAHSQSMVCRDSGRILTRLSATIWWRIIGPPDLWLKKKCRRKSGRQLSGNANRRADYADRCSRGSVSAAAELLRTRGLHWPVAYETGGRVRLCRRAGVLRCGAIRLTALALDFRLDFFGRRFGFLRA